MLTVQSFEHGLAFNATNGKLDAFNQLVLTHQDIVYHHVYSLLGDPDRAEDVTQESFIKAYQKLDDYHGGSFRAWVLQSPPTPPTICFVARKSTSHPAALSYNRQW